MVVGLIILITINIIILSVTSGRYALFGSGRIVISIIAPFQGAVTHAIRFVRGVWRQYFFLVCLRRVLSFRLISPKPVCPLLLTIVATKNRCGSDTFFVMRSKNIL